MSDAPYDGATPEQLKHPMVNELLAIHNMFRNEMVAMLAFVDQLISGEQAFTGSETAARYRRLMRAGVQYTQMLHGHHHHESALLFPALRQEDPELAQVVDRLESEHAEIAVLIDKFADSIHEFSAIQPNIMNSDLQKLSEALRAHLAYEETHVCPVLARFTHWPGAY